jgi:hypothetical protein
VCEKPACAEARGSDAEAIEEARKISRHRETQLTPVSALRKFMFRAKTRHARKLAEAMRKQSAEANLSLTPRHKSLGTHPYTSRRMARMWLRRLWLDPRSRCQNVSATLGAALKLPVCILWRPEKHPPPPVMQPLGGAQTALWLRARCSHGCFVAWERQCSHGCKKLAGSFSGLQSLQVQCFGQNRTSASQVRTQSVTRNLPPGCSQTLCCSRWMSSTDPFRCEDLAHGNCEFPWDVSRCHARARTVHRPRKHRCALGYTEYLSRASGAHDPLRTRAALEPKGSCIDPCLNSLLHVPG